MHVVIHDRHVRRHKDATIPKMMKRARGYSVDVDEVLVTLGAGGGMLVLGACGGDEILRRRLGNSGSPFSLFDPETQTEATKTRETEGVVEMDAEDVVGWFGGGYIYCQADGGY